MYAMRNLRAPTTVAPAVGWQTGSPMSGLRSATTPHLFDHSFKLTAPDVLQVGAVGSAGGRFVQIHRGPSTCSRSRPRPRSARRTLSSSVTPSMGINGTTSAAPMRGWAPWCVVRSISSTALATPRTAASVTAAGGAHEGEDAAIMVGVRLAVEKHDFRGHRGSPERSRPSWRCPRPSEKLGNALHQLSRHESFTLPYLPGGGSDA